MGDEVEMTNKQLRKKALEMLDRNKGTIEHNLNSYTVMKNNAMVKICKDQLEVANYLINILMTPQEKK